MPLMHSKKHNIGSLFYNLPHYIGKSFIHPPSLPHHNLPVASSQSSNTPLS